MHLSPCDELTQLIASSDFARFAERVKQENQIAILPASPAQQNDETILKFRCQRSNVEFVGAALDLLEEFLDENAVSLVHV